MQITIFVPLTRFHRIDPMVEQIAALDKGSHEIDLVVGIDNLDIHPYMVKDAFQKLTDKPIRMFHTGNQLAGEVNMAVRRQRITEMFQKAQILIPRTTNIVFTIEDDTKVQSDTLIRLLKTYFDTPNVGLVTGAQVGRWGFRMIGIWKTDNVHEMQTIETLLPPDEPCTQEIDTSGFYCFITSRFLFCTTSLTFGQFGPDVYFGLELRKLGYVNVVDWSILAGHVINNGEVLLPDNSCIVVKYERLNNQWRRTEPKNNIKINI